MDAAWSGKRMPRLPRPGEWVRWRNPRHAKTQWWDETYGPGPFEVVGVVNHAAHDAPHGVVLKTRLGEREVNEVWLALTDPPAREAAGAGLRRRIVVADDDRDGRESLRELLSRLGHDVVAVQGGRQVVEVCRLAAPELVVSDIHMPDLGGVEAAVEVNRDRAVPFILISGCHDEETLARAAADPVMAYLAKPVREADLAAAITVALRRFEQRQAMQREVEGLRRDLEDRKLLERAKGVLMRRLELDEGEAYRRLRKKAGDEGRKPAELAGDVVRAEELFVMLEVQAVRQPDVRPVRPTDPAGRTLAGARRKPAMAEGPLPHATGGSSASASPPTVKE